MNKILVFSLIILLVCVYSGDCGMKDMMKLLKGGAMLGGMHMMPLPIPLPIPIRMERQHHHTYPVCKAQPIHIHKQVEYIPYPVEEKRERPVGKKETGGSKNYGEEEESSSSY